MAEYDRLLIERSHLAGECWDAGVPIEQIAEVLGITVMRAYQIKDRKYVTLQSKKRKR